MEKWSVKVDWAKSQIPKEAQENPDILVPKTIEEMLARWGNPKDANPKDILAIQAALSRLGYPPGKLDAIFKDKDKVTSHTMEAIRRFQKEHGLKKVDWQPGKETLHQMLVALSEQASKQSAAQRTTNAPLKAAETSRKPAETRLVAPPQALGISKKPVVISWLQKPIIARGGAEEEWLLVRNLHGLWDAASMLIPGSHFLDQTIDNIHGAIDKPKDVIRPVDLNAQTAILIPGFFCNQGVMRGLGDKLSASMNVIYPDIGIIDSSRLSLNEMADKIVVYILKLEQEGKLRKDGQYTIIGHSLGGNIALLVSQKLRVNHIVQVSTPNKTPPVAKISWLGFSVFWRDFIPAMIDLRNIENIYKRVTPKGPLETLTYIIAKKDAFIGTNVQWVSGIPSNIPIGKTEGIIVAGWHIDPIITDSGKRTIINAVSATQSKK